MTTNKPVSEETKEKLSGSVPTGEGEYSGMYGGPAIDVFQQFGDVSIASYKFPDGSAGFAMFSDSWTFHVDNNNNMILSTGTPSQSGCGGKMIQKSESVVQRTGSISTHVTGRKDDGVTKQEVKDGNVEQSKLPSYSLKVEGDILIEAIGGEVAIKGDNITLNATSTLNLKSGKDINIQAGEKSGRINLNASKVELDSSFFVKNISGGEYSKGAGEVDVEQYDQFATTSISTPGDINYTVNGNYTVGVTGDYKQIVNKNYSIQVDQDFAHKVLGDWSVEVSGKVKHVFTGVNKTSAQKESYVLELGPAAKNIPAYKVTSGSDISMETLIGPITFKTTKGFTTFEIAEKEIKGIVGKKMGEFVVNEQGAELKYAETSSISVSASEVRAKAPAIYLN